MLKQKNTNQGFTIVELLIATTVFSLVLVVFLTAFLRVSQIFYKGISLSNTQEASRRILESIANDIQFSNATYSYDTLNDRYFCVGDHRYSFSPGVQVGSGHTDASGNADDYGVVKETMGVCSNPFDGHGKAIDFNKAEKLLDPGMQLNDIKITSLTNGATVSLTVVFYGADKGMFYSNLPGAINDINDPNYDAYKKPDARCTSLPGSVQFCAVANYQSTILHI